MWQRGRAAGLRLSLHRNNQRQSKFRNHHQFANANANAKAKASGHYFLSTAASTTDDEVEAKAPSSGGIFSPERAVATPGKSYNRWLMAVPAFTTHLCIGSPYAWSSMSGPITREFGFVCSSAADWTLGEATVPLSIVFALQVSKFTTWHFGILVLALVLALALALALALTLALALVVLVF